MRAEGDTGNVRHVLIDGFPAVFMRVLVVVVVNAMTAAMDDVLGSDTAARGTLANRDRDGVVPLSRYGRDKSGGRDSEGDSEGKERRDENHDSN